MNNKNRSKIANLKDLVKAVKNEKINMKDCIDMHQFCAFWGAYDVFSYFEDIVILVHGPYGCVGNRHYLNPMGSYNLCDNKPHYTTNLSEKDVIFGGEKKLTESIYEVAEKYPDKKIAIITNCCADIIGDDVEGCIESLPENISSRVLFMNTGGYSGKSYRRGTEMAFKLLVSNNLNDDVCEKINEENNIKNKESKNKKVNLFLRRWLWNPIKDEEINEISKMLNLINVDVNCVFDQNMNFEKLVKMRQSDLNVALCNFFAHGFFDEFQRKYNVPYLYSHAPIGLKSSVEWLKGIVQALGLDEDVNSLPEVQQLEIERKNLVKKIGKSRDCIIWSQTGDRLLSLLKFALELEMNPIIVGIEPYIIKEKMNLFQREVLKGGLNSKVFASKYVEDVKELVDDLDDPIIFCNDNYFPQNKVFKYRFAHNAVYGFNGVRKMYKEMSNILDRNPSEYSLFIEE